MRILFAAGRETAYPRNAQLLRALAQQGQVREVAAAGSRLTMRLASAGHQLFWRRYEQTDLLFLGFYGHPLVPVARSRWRGPLVFDAFVSTYDTLCSDRQLFAPRSIPGWLAFQLDRLSCRQADIVLVDTRAQAQYFANTFGVPPAKLRVVYVGCDLEAFRPMEVTPPQVPTILFYGTFLPIHGIDVIVKAACHLAGAEVLFKIIGHGQEYARIRRLISDIGCKNVDLQPPVALGELPRIIAGSTLCLGGHFGRSEKAGRVIAGKTVQCLACGKPTILGDNPANRELFTHGQDAWMCPMGDPKALADAISQLLASPALCADLGRAGRETVARACGDAATAQAVQAAIEAARQQYQNGVPKTR